MKVLVKPSEGALVPKYQTPGSSGADITAYIQEPVIIAPGDSALIPSGLRTALPDGYEFQLRPRSGLALKHQISLTNSPGTVDSDYRNDIGVILINHGKTPFTVEPGMRIAQMVLVKIEKIDWIITDELPDSVRGEGGFGHTGV